MYFFKIDFQYSYPWWGKQATCICKSAFNWAHSFIYPGSLPAPWLAVQQSIFPPANNILTCGPIVLHNKNAFPYTRIWFFKLSRWDHRSWPESAQTVPDMRDDPPLPAGRKVVLRNDNLQKVLNGVCRTAGLCLFGTHARLASRQWVRVCVVCVHRGEGTCWTYWHTCNPLPPPQTTQNLLHPMN